METNGYKINEIDIKKVVEESESYNFEDLEYNYLNIYYDRDISRLYTATSADTTDGAVLLVGTIYEPTSEDELRNMITERFEPKTISIDNGNTTISAEEALEKSDMPTIINLMDDYTIDVILNEISGKCTVAEFINAYLAKGAYDIVIG